MKLLLIEDTAAIVTRMKAFLRPQYIVEAVKTGEEAIEMAQRTVYDAIILDLGLPDIPGLVVCQRLRDLPSNAPILVVTGDDRLISRVSLLNAGADDFIIKPFHADEFKARLTAVLRRPAILKDPDTLTCLDLVMDTARRQVTRAGTTITLRRKEFDILEYLLRNHGRVVTREMILNHVWDSTKDTWGSVVDVHIKRLRDKIDRPFAVPLIKTAYGLGYRIDAME